MIASLRSRWWIVAACVLGLMVSGGPINIFTFGVFLRAVTEDLQIGRGTLGSAMLITNALSALTGPVLGYLLDRYGSRRVMLPGIVCFAGATALQSLLTPSLLVIYLLFTIRGLCANGQSPIAYAFTVAKWFDRHRGLAMGIAMAGVGLGTSVIPPIVAQMIGLWGWRTAYLGLAGIILVLAGVPVLLLIREPSAADSARQPDLPRGTLPGLSMAQALTGTWRFWGLVVAFLFGVIALNGLLTQIVAILMDRGLKLPAATGVLAASGVAAIVGRILSGWCVDRFFGPYVGIGFFILPMIGIALFGTGAGGAIPYLGAMLCGMALGAEIDLMAFFVSRYFGLRAYGKIFGTMFGCFAGSTGVGPFLSGLSFDLYHSYVPAFGLYEILLALTCVILLFLGPYPYPAHYGAPQQAGRDEVPAQ